MRAMHEIREILNPTPLEVVSLMDWQMYPPQAEYEKLLPYFDHKLWIENMWKYAVARREFLQMTGIDYPLMTRILESQSFYNSFFGNLENVQHVRNTVDSVFQTQRTTPDLSHRQFDAVEGIKREFQNGSPNPVICISGDHSTTYFSTRAAQELGSQGKAGLLVFDQHIDTEQDEFVLTTGIAKASVFSQMARLPHYMGGPRLAAIGIIGSTRGAYRRHFAEEDPVLRKTGTDFIIYPEDEYTSTDGTIDRIKLKNCIDLAIYRMKAAGVSSFGISVDMDVLNEISEKLTGMEYSLLPAHVNLGAQNLKRTWSARKHSEWVPDYYEGFILRLLKASVAILEPKPELTQYQLEHYQPATVGYGTGMSVNDICSAIYHASATARMHGIQFGLSISRTGKKYLGDIVELAGYDFRSNTATAAHKIAEAMKKAALL